MTGQQDFISNGMFLVIHPLNADARAKWGKMNAQQMVEHLADFFDVSSEQIQFDLVTPEEHLLKFKQFLMSDKEFRENTKAPVTVLPEEPLPIRYASMDVSKQKLRDAVNRFVEYFKDHPER